MRRHDGRTRRCSHRLIRQRRLTLELLERRDLLATVSWDGGGDNSSWGDRFNWGGDQLPGTLDDVVIADSNLTVTHRTASTTVRSITSQAAINLTSGSLKVTAGVSMLHGALTAETGTALRAEGADVSLVVLGATDVNGASLFALNGGEISLPNLTSHTHDTSTLSQDARFVAEGVGSILDLPNLTALTGSDDYNSDMLIQASSGGHVQLPSLTEIQVPGTYEYRRSVQLLADGTGSLLDLPALTSFIDAVSGATGEYSLLDASNGGTILAPNLTRLVGVQLRSRADGTIPIGQITDVTNGTLRVFGTTPDFNSLTNIDRSSLLVQDGGLLRLLGVTSYTHDNGAAYHDARFVIEGVGSVLDLPNLTTIRGSSDINSDLFIRALLGGLVDLSGLQSIPCGAVSMQADGPGSVIDASLLSHWSGEKNFSASGMEAKNGGSILLGPALTSLDTIDVTLGSGGSIPTGQFTSYTNGVVTVDGASADFSGMTVVRGEMKAVQGGSIRLNANLTSLDMVDLTLATGGSIGTAQLESYTNGTATLDGATADFSNVTNIDGAGFLVSGGMTLELPLVRSYTLNVAARRSWQAKGLGSVLSLPNVQSILGPNQSLSSVSIEASDGGRIDLDAVTMISGGPVNVVARGNGSRVRLPGCSAFLDSDPDGNGRWDSSRLEASNDGIVDLGNNALELLGVSVSVDPGSAIHVSSFDLRDRAVLSGSGQIDADVINGGAVRPGGDLVGQLTIAGLYTQRPSGTLDIDIAGVMAGTEHDVLQVLGDSTLAGTLSVKYRNAFGPGAADQFTVLISDTLMGDFGKVTGVASSSGQVLQPRVSDTTVVLNVGYERKTAVSGFDGAYAVATADLDGDGDLDIVGVAHDGGLLGWFEFDPRVGTFAAHLIDGEVDGIQLLDAGDLDRDGDVDIVAAVPGTKELAWWENSLDGFSARKVIDATFDGGFGVQIADIDGDLWPDVVGTFYGGLTWWRNDGLGAFVPTVVDNAFYFESPVEVADLDRDGDLDIVSVSGSGLAWWANNADGSFSKSAVDGATLGISASLRIADLDGDSRPDLIATYYDTLTWYRAQPDGTFAATVLANNLQLATGLDVADIDRDGRPDIVVTDQFGETSLWKNRGDGSFQQSSLGSYGKGQIAAADLDQDGDLDIVAGRQAWDEITWWENRLSDRLTVVALTPAPTAALASMPTEIRVEFNVAVDPATANAQSITVTSAGPDQRFGTMDDIQLAADEVRAEAADIVAVLAFNQGLPEGIYQITVRDTVASRRGERLDGDGAYTTPPSERLPSGDGQAGGDFIAGFVVDLTPPTAPARFRSTSHVANAVSTDDTIDVAWSAGRDALSGLEGYVIEWDNQPETIPLGSAVVSADTIAIQSPKLGDGDRHYAHLATVDRAGNRSAVVHLGPFSIENGGPEIAAVSPAPDSIEYAPPAQGRITFKDDDIDVSTITSANIKVEAAGGDGTFGDGNEIAVPDQDGIIAFDPRTRTAIFEPATTLPDDQYRITVLDAVVDRAGKRLDGDADGQPGGVFTSIFGVTVPKHVSGWIQGDAVWSGLILVDGSVTVLGQLTVTPGTIIKVQDGAGITVYGNMQAQGTATRPIWITSLADDEVGGDSDGLARMPRPSIWRGITLSGGDVELDHVTLKYADVAIHISYATDSHAVVRNSVLSDGWLGCQIGAGIFDISTYSSITAENTVFASFSGNAFYAQGSTNTGVFRNVTLVNNGFGMSVWSDFAGAIGIQSSKLTLENSVVAYNGNGLSHPLGDIPEIEIRNTIFHNPVGREIVWNGDPGKPDLARHGNRVVEPQFVDWRAGDYELAPGSPAIDAGRGATATPTDLLGRPRHDDPGVANIGAGLPAYVDLGAYEFQGNTRPIDLAVTNVATPLPQSVDPGDTVTLGWTVANAGQRAAPGGWSDAIYLSTDSVLSPDDMLLKTVVHAAGLDPGASYTASQSVIVPDAAGPLYILVQANHDRTIRESSETNNLGLSASPLEVAVDTIALNAPATASVAANHWTYFRFDAQPGTPIRFSLDAAAATGSLGLYLRRGQIPSLERFDASATIFNQPDQELRLLDPVTGTYYLGVYGRSVPGGTTNVTLSAALTPLALRDVVQETVAAQGRVTLELLGDNFAADDQIRLIAPDNVTLLGPVSVTVDDPGRAFATFDLAGAAIGTYDVQITSATGATVSLADTLAVVAEGVPDFFTNVVAPSLTRPGRKATLTIEYGNRGTADIRSPLLSLSGDDDMQWQIPGTTQFVTGTGIEFLALSSSGPANVLRPGQTERVEVRIQTPFRQATLPYAVSWLSPDATELVDWDPLQSELQPPAIAADAWQVIWSNFAEQTGETWGDYVAMLGENAAYLATLGQMVYGTGELFSFEALQASGLSPVSQLASSNDLSVAAPGMTLDFYRTSGQSIPSRFALGPLGRGWTHNWDLYLRTLPSGEVLMHTGSGGWRSFSPNSDGTLNATAGDYGRLTRNGDGSFALRETTGHVYRFRPDLMFESLTDRNGNSIAATYTGGRLSRLTHSSGQSLSLEYNAAGRITRVADQVGRANTYEYDSSGKHLLRVTQYGNRVLEYLYETAPGSRQHALTTITYPGGSHEFFSYDAAGRLAATELDGGEERLRYAYDSTGRITITDNANAASVVYVDHRGLFSKSVDALGHATQFVYDDALNLVEAIRPDGLGYQYAYDEFGNTTQVTDPLGYSTIFAYDTTFGNLLWFRDARGNTTTYSYDRNGNPTAETNAAGLAETYEVDLFGNVTQKINRRGQPIDYTYNADGLLVRKDYPDGTAITYAYDPRGNLVRATDAAGDTVFEYETADRLTKVTYPQGWSLTYSYDAAGRRTQLATHDGFITDYSYDTTGRLTRVTDANGAPYVAYTYDSVGRLIREDKGNGTYTTYEYDQNGQLLHLVNRGPDDSIHSRFDFTYDSLGRRTSMDTSYGLWTHTYDATGQLTGAVLDSTDPQMPDQNLVYVYDPAGNRVLTRENGVTTNYVTNETNFYVTVGNEVWTADLDGNVQTQTSDTVTRRYLFDFDNRLVEVQDTSGVLSFAYDPLGNRVIRRAKGVQVQFLVEPTGLTNVIIEYTSDGGVGRTCTDALGLAACSVPTVAVQYFAFDGIGSTVGITDRFGRQTQMYAYDPFGQVIQETIPNGNAFQYVGQSGIATETANLLYVRARFYDPTIGRFLSEDPIGLRSSDFNHYRYARNDPVGFVDITGNYYEPSTHGSYRRYLRERPYIQKPEPIGGGSSGHDSPSSGTPERPAGNEAGDEGGAGGDAGTGGAGGGAGTGGAEGGGGIGGAFFGFMMGGFWFNIASLTPEDKFGPIGFDPAETPIAEEKRFVRGDDPFHYRIDFWNKPDATVPTQDALILDTLAPNLDWSTFRFTNFGFLKWNVDLPPGGTQAIDQQVDLRPDMNLAVNVKASFNPETGEIRWWFQAVDPLTGDYPEDPLAGFLPPFNPETQYELGWVEFDVRPKAGLKTGDTIENLAHVQFDFIGPFNPAPKDENGGPRPWLNTIDAAAPASSATDLPASTGTREFAVAWSGQDDAGGSGVASYDVYVSMDGGAFGLWLEGTTATSSQFTGQPGHTYSFYSVATDNVGYREVKVLAAEASTTIEHLATSALLKTDHPIGSIYGQSIVFTATVGAATPGVGLPSGTVQLVIDGVHFAQPVPLNDGTADISTAGLPAGSHSILVSFVSDSGIFADTQSEPLSQIVAPAPLTIAADDATKPYGAPLPQLTATYTGFVNGDTPASLTPPPTLATTATAASPVGSYPITVSGAVAPNYTVTYVEGTLTVVPGGWQNPDNRFDVTGEGDVTALDVLTVINYINSHANDTALPSPPAVPPPFYDVNGDGNITAQDVLQVINSINSGTSGGAEAEAIALSTAPAAVDDTSPLLAANIRDRTSPGEQILSRLSLERSVPATVGAYGRTTDPRAEQSIFVREQGNGRTPVAAPKPRLLNRRGAELALARATNESRSALDLAVEEVIRDDLEAVLDTIASDITACPPGLFV